MKLNALKIKDLVSIVPIIQGGMGIGVSGWRLASAVANAGGIGVISAAQSGYQEQDFDTKTFEANQRAFRQEILKAKKNTQGIIGVNIMVAMRNYKDFVKVAVDEKVDLIISGAGLPLELPEFVKGSSTKIAPIVSSLRAAKLILRRWTKAYQRYPDAIVVEGPEAGGHLGFKKEELVTGTAQDVYTIVSELKQYFVEEGLDIPIIAAGGIFYGKDIVKSIKAGADGVQMATRFVATDECDASQAFKEAYVQARPEDVLIMDSPVGLPGRALKTAMLDKVYQEGRIPVKKCYQCIHKCNPQTTPFCITKALINAVEGQIEESLLFVGSRVTEVQKIQSVQQIFDELVNEVEEF